MSVNDTARWFWRCLNFAFVTWGVLFLLGMIHGIFRGELSSRTSLKVIFGAASVLHLIALLLLLGAVCYGLAYFARRVQANARARRRIEQLSGEQGETWPKEKRAIYAEEYARDPKTGATAAQPA